MVNKIIDGVGADAEIVTNSRGGKQSKSPMAMHLIDPKFLIDFCDDRAEALEYVDESRCTCVDDEDEVLHNCYQAIALIAQYMKDGDEYFLDYAFEKLGDSDGIEPIIEVAKVLQYGVGRYAPNNWRLIPREEHLNHALIHLAAMIVGDTQDDHKGHALCRLMMAKATKESDNFSYTEYVKPEENVKDILDDILNNSKKIELGLEGFGKRG